MAFVRDCCPAYEERRRRSRRRVCRAVTPRGCPGWGACGAWCSCGCARWIAAHRKLQAVAGRLHVRRVGLGMGNGQGGRMAAGLQGLRGAGRRPGRLRRRGGLQGR